MDIPFCKRDIIALPQYNNDNHIECMSHQALIKDYNWLMLELIDERKSRMAFEKLWIEEHKKYVELKFKTMFGELNE